MGKRKRLQKPKRIQLPLYSEDGSPVDFDSDYDDWDEDLDELEKLGVIEYPKTIVIIDGETVAFNALKNGEDW